MSTAKLIDDYLAGPDLLRRAVAGLSDAQLDARPVPGKWSTRQVVAHLADFEIVYADRIKRVLAEERPTLFAGDPDRFAAGLAYDRRNVAEDVALVAAIRRHLGTILGALAPEAFQRVGLHSEAGELTLEQLLRSVTEHLPHHVRFIEEKRRLLE